MSNVGLWGGGESYLRGLFNNSVKFIELVALARCIVVRA